MTITTPTVGGSANTWGTILNAALESLQSQVTLAARSINVKDAAYGAIGDNTHDDTAAIQAAIDDLPAAGGVVYLPEGVYKTTTTLVIASDSVVLLGAGTTTSIIRYFGSGIAVSTDNTGIRRYGGIEHLMIQCMTGGATSLTLDNAYRWRFDKVRFESQNGTTGVAVDIVGSLTKSTYFNEFYSCDFHGSYASVKLNNNVNGNRFYGGVMEGSGFSVLMPGTTSNSGTNMFTAVGIQSSGANSGGVIIQVGTLGLSGGVSQAAYNSFVNCRVETSTATTIRFETNGWYNAIIGGSMAANTTVVDLAAGPNLVLVNSGAGAVFAFPKPVTAPTLTVAGLTTTGTLSVGSVPSWTIGTAAVQKSFNVTFANAVANQKADVYLAGNYSGVFEVTLTAGYGSVNGIGAIKAIYGFGGNSATGAIYHNTMAVIVAQGNLPTEFALMPIAWDSTNSRWKISIAHRTSLGNSVGVDVKFIGADNTAAGLAAAGLAMSAVYTTDATVPVVNRRTITSVREGFGAVGNGVADDTAAIQAAINAASAAGGGTVYFPAGTYKITAALTMPSDVGLIGAGRAVTTIKGALGAALLKSPNTATRYYSWILRDIGFDNTSRATAGGIAVDMTNISHARVDNVTTSNVATGLVLNEAAYYNELSTFQVNGATLAVKIGGGATSTNECLFNNLRINDVTNGVTINNSTNVTFVKPSIEAYTGIGIDIAPTSATQYVNLVAPRFENSGGVGVGYRNRALAQATTVVGGMAAGVATPHINDAAAKELTIIAPGVASPRLDSDQLALYAGGNLNALVYSSGSTVYFRNAADSGYIGIDVNNLSVRGILSAASSMTMGPYALGTSNTINSSVTGDTQNRFMLDASGKMLWGSGAAGGDTNLYRGAADVLRTDDTFRCGTFTTAGRPTAAAAGIGGQIYDTTLSKPIWSDGTTWRDAAGTAV